MPASRRVNAKQPKPTAPVKPAVQPHPDGIRVFLSSRIDPTVPKAGGGTTSLREVRSRIQARLYEGIGQQLLNLFASENEPALTDQATIEYCLAEARRSDLFVCLGTGDPGRTSTKEPLGICHRELTAAIADSPDKVILIVLDTPDAQAAFKAHPDFQILVEGFAAARKKWTRRARTDEELVDEAVRAVLEGVRTMGARAHREWRRSRAYAGNRLRWASKTYSERALAITAAIERQLSRDPAVVIARPYRIFEPGLVTLKLGTEVLVGSFCGVPDAFAVADARKYAGYPFREDEQHMRSHRKAIGPLHIVGIHRSLTESQMRAHLGNADIAIYRTNFGFLAQDRSQAIQVAYLTECEDEDATLTRTADLQDALNQAEYADLVRPLAQRRATMVL